MHLCSGLWCLLCPGHRLIQQFRLLRVQGVHGNILCGAGQTSVYPGGSARAKTQVVKGAGMMMEGADKATVEKLVSILNNKHII